MSLQDFFRRGRDDASTKRKVAIQPFLLTAAKRVPYSAFNFKLKISSGIPYEIQATTNLKDWDFVACGSATENEIDYLDSNAPKFSYRFYRVLAGGVYSANAIGYASIVAPPGFSLIANPFQSTNNSVAELFKGMPDGATLSKFNTQFSKLTENKLKDGKWTNPNEQLLRCEGAIFFNPTSDYKTLNFFGEVSQGKFSIPIPAGFSIRSSSLPKPGRLDLDLGFPVMPGDVVHLFDSSSQKYVIYPYDEKAWAVNPPIVGMGEAFWVAKKTAKNWVQSFFAA